MYQITIYERMYDIRTDQPGPIMWVDHYADVTYASIRGIDGPTEEPAANGNGESAHELALRTEADPKTRYYSEFTDLIIRPRFGPALHVCAFDNPNWGREVAEYLAKASSEGEDDDYMAYQEVMTVLESMPKISPLVNIQISCNDGNPDQFFVRVGCTGCNRFGAFVDAEHHDIGDPVEFEKLLRQVNEIAHTLVTKEEEI